MYIIRLFQKFLFLSFFSVIYAEESCSINSELCDIKCDQDHTIDLQNVENLNENPSQIFFIESTGDFDIKLDSCTNAKI